MSCQSCESAKAKFKCKACQTATYCGASCQRSDWTDNHELVCFSVSNPNLEHIGRVVRFTFDPEYAEPIMSYVQENPRELPELAQFIQAVHHDDLELVEGFSDSYRRWKHKRRQKKGERKYKKGVNKSAKWKDWWEDRKAKFGFGRRGAERRQDVERARRTQYGDY